MTMETTTTMTDPLSFSVEKLDTTLFNHTYPIFVPGVGLLDETIIAWPRQLHHSATVKHFFCLNVKTLN